MFIVHFRRRSSFPPKASLTAKKTEKEQVEELLLEYLLFMDMKWPGCLKGCYISKAASRRDDDGGRVSQAVNYGSYFAPLWNQDLPPVSWEMS